MGQEKPEPTPSTAAEQGGPIQADLERVESWKQVAHVRVSGEYVESLRDKAARQLARKIHIDGFRKGKVPASLVRSRYAGQVEQEAIETLVPACYRQILDQNDDLHPIAEPTVENIDLPESGEVSFDLNIEVRPDLELEGLDEIEATRVLPPITDERVDSAIEEFRDRQSTWEDKGEASAEEGDALMIDYAPLDEEGNPQEEEGEENHPLLLGAEGVLPEFNAALVGMQAGEETEIEVNYPVDYPNEELRGSIRKHRVRVKEVRAKKGPELDDAFVKEHTPHETLEELRAEARQQLEKGARRESDRHLREQLIDAILEKNEVPVLPSLEARYLQAMLQDAERNQGELTDEQKKQLAEAYGPMAQRAVRRMVVLDSLRRSEEISVTDEEMEAKIAELAAEQNMEPADFRRAVERAQNLDRLRSDLEEDKVFAMLEERAKITVSEELPEPPGVQDQQASSEEPGEQPEQSKE